MQSYAWYIIPDNEQLFPSLSYYYIICFIIISEHVPPTYIYFLKFT